ncbi:MAG: NAD(P)-dependent oxidoreductase [Gaiellaceae bacterium]
MGLIGLGNMGAAIAERVLEAGFPLVVYNRTRSKAEPLEARGARIANSAGELAALCKVILTSVPDDDALEGITAEVAAAAQPGTVLVDMSTVSPAASARVASVAEAASVEYLRAPVSGNPTVVRSGGLTFIVSGPRKTLEHVEPVLRAIGPTIQHVGDAEQARVVKLAVNLMIAGLGQLMAEALLLGEAAGVSRKALLDAMGASAAGAPFVKYKAQPLLDDDYSATFTTALMEKDVDLILDAADENHVSLPVARELKTLLRAAIDAGYGHDDFIALFPYLRSVSRDRDQEVVR